MSLDKVAPSMTAGSPRPAAPLWGAPRSSCGTVQPAPYQIPTDGSCGKLIAAAGWHVWRPAHLHDPYTQADGTATVAYDFVLDPEKG